MSFSKKLASATTADADIRQVLEGRFGDTSFIELIHSCWTVSTVLSVPTGA